MMQLLQLPSELLERILVQLHPMDVLLLRRVCQSFMNIIDSSIELQLRIELAADGFLLGDRGKLPAADVLKLVLGRRKAFDMMLPQSYWEVNMSRADSERIEISDGVWAHAPDFKGNTFRNIYFEELLPPYFQDGRWTFSTGDLGFDAHDFSFWLEGDALFVVESVGNGITWRLHLRQLSTNVPHSRAFAPSIDFHKGNREIWQECEIVSHEERLSIEFCNLSPFDCTQTAAIILDWTTGKILLPYTILLDIAFLTKDLAIVAPSPLSEDTFLTIQVQSLESGTVLYRCKLPLWAGHYSLRFLKCPTSNHGTKCPTRYAKLFVPDPRVSILGISVKFLSGQCQSLLDATRISGATELIPLFEWDRWGQNTTRWLSDTIEGDYGFRTLHGARLLSTVRSLSHQTDDSKRTVLMDFNSRPIRRGLQYRNGNLSVKDETGPLFWYLPGIPSKGLPSTLVGSTLPCRTSYSSPKDHYWSQSLEANSILGRADGKYHCFSFLPLPSLD